MDIVAGKFWVHLSGVPCLPLAACAGTAGWRGRSSATVGGWLGPLHPWPGRSCGAWQVAPAAAHQGAPGAAPAHCLNHALLHNKTFWLPPTLKKQKKIDKRYVTAFKEDLGSVEPAERALRWGVGVYTVPTRDNTNRQTN